MHSVKGTLPFKYGTTEVGTEHRWKLFLGGPMKLSSGICLPDFSHDGNIDLHFLKVHTTMAYTSNLTQFI